MHAERNDGSQQEGVVVESCDTQCHALVTLWVGACTVYDVISCLSTVTFYKVFDPSFLNDLSHEHVNGSCNPPSAKKHVFMHWDARFIRCKHVDVRKVRLH